VLVVETSDPAETEALGAELATRLRVGDVVLVQGELGAGKTTLVRGAARALGVTDPVTSPTFSIGHRYGGAGVTVSHLDLYRLASLEDEDPGLLADYLGAGRIAFVEWPAGDSAELADARMRVTLSHRGGDQRRIEVVEGLDVELATAASTPEDGTSADAEGMQA
jgi:tRNA threonylcarbamoyladenosine biosynthesis protein TsaE